MKSLESKNYQEKMASHVTPYNTLFFGPMPCEEKAAAIRTKTLESMKNNDIADVAYRYLQNRRGANNTLNEAVFWGCLFISSIYGISRHNNNRLIPLFSTIPMALHIPPNIGNTIRYRETKQSSEEWLNRKIGKEKLAEIQSIKFNQQGMFSLNALIAREQIDRSSIKDKTKKEDSVFSFWDMDR